MTRENQWAQTGSPSTAESRAAPAVSVGKRTLTDRTMLDAPRDHSSTPVTANGSMRRMKPDRGGSADPGAPVTNVLSGSEVEKQQSRPSLQSLFGGQLQARRPSHDAATAAPPAGVVPADPASDSPARLAGPGELLDPGTDQHDEMPAPGVTRERFHANGEDHELLLVVRDDHGIDVMMHSYPRYLIDYLPELESQVGTIQDSEAKKTAEAKLQELHAIVRRIQIIGLSSRGDNQKFQDINPCLKRIGTLLGQISDLGGAALNCMIPPSDIDIQSLDIRGYTCCDQVTAKILSLNPGNGRGGSPPQDQGGSWVSLKVRHPDLVRGHVLNKHLHGPGTPDNIAPISGGYNSAMSESYEEFLKTDILQRGYVYSYFAKVHYGHAPQEGYSSADLEAIPARIEVRYRKLKRKNPEVSGIRAEDWTPDGEEVQPALGMHTLVPADRERSKGIRGDLEFIRQVHDGEVRPKTPHQWELARQGQSLQRITDFFPPEPPVDHGDEKTPVSSGDHGRNEEASASAWYASDDGSTSGRRDGLEQADQVASSDTEDDGDLRDAQQAAWTAPPPVAGPAHDPPPAPRRAQATAPPREPTPYVASDETAIDRPDPARPDCSSEDWPFLAAADAAAVDSEEDGDDWDAQQIAGAADASSRRPTIDTAPAPNDGFDDNLPRPTPVDGVAASLFEATRPAGGGRPEAQDALRPRTPPTERSSRKRARTSSRVESTLPTSGRRSIAQDAWRFRALSRTQPPPPKRARKKTSHVESTLPTSGRRSIAQDAWRFRGLPRTQPPPQNRSGKRKRLVESKI